MRFYYAQNKEDLFIKAFFPDVKQGFYIDVGANDPVIDSVTKLFYDEGWTGINIDPIHKHIVNLKKSRPKDINLEVGVSDKNGEQLFTEYINGDGLSTFAKSMREYYKQNNVLPTVKYKEYKVKMKTLDDIIEENSIKHIHFLKVDVEGYEYEVLKGYKWINPRPEVLCIEVSHLVKDWRPFIESNGYKLVFRDGLNNYYLAEESLKRDKYFDYPDTALSGDPVYYSTYLEIITKEQKKHRQNLEKVIARLEDKEKELSFTQARQRDIRYLTKRLYEELLLRLNKRSKLYKTKKTLIYRQDFILSKLNNKPQSISELVKTIHKRDETNIIIKRTFMLNYLKGWFWKLATLIFMIIGKAVKRTVI